MTKEFVLEFVKKEGYYDTCSKLGHTHAYEAEFGESGNHKNEIRQEISQLAELGAELLDERQMISDDAASYAEAEKLISEVLWNAYYDGRGDGSADS